MSASGMLAATLREVAVPQWRVHVELQTGSLAGDIQLTALAAHLGADAALADASLSAASLGSRYSVTATITLAAASAQAAQNLATAAFAKRVCQFGHPHRQCPGLRPRAQPMIISGPAQFIEVRLHGQARYSRPTRDNGNASTRILHHFQGGPPMAHFGRQIRQRFGTKAVIIATVFAGLAVLAGIILATR